MLSILLCYVWKTKKDTKELFMKSFNSKMTRICAFCKNWFDPGCTAIKPRSGDFFEIDDKVKKRCMICKLDKNALSSCGKFESKFKK